MGRSIYRQCLNNFQTSLIYMDFKINWHRYSLLGVVVPFETFAKVGLGSRSQLKSK